MLGPTLSGLHSGWAVGICWVCHQPDFKSIGWEDSWSSSILYHWGIDDTQSSPSEKGGEEPNLWILFQRRKGWWFRPPQHPPTGDAKGSSPLPVEPGRSSHLRGIKLILLQPKEHGKIGRHLSCFQVKMDKKSMKKISEWTNGWFCS